MLSATLAIVIAVECVAAGSEAKSDKQLSRYSSVVGANKSTLRFESISIKFIESGLRVLEPGKTFVTEYDYRPGIYRDRLFLWKVRVRPYAVFYAAIEAIKIEESQICDVTSDSGKPSSLIRAGNDLSNWLGTGCSDQESKRLKRSIDAVLPDMITESPYLTCFRKLQTSYDRIAMKLHSKRNAFFPEGQKPLLSCVQDLPTKDPAKVAMFQEEGRRIAFRSSALKELNDGAKLNNKMFHELLHSEGLPEDETKVISACCSQPFDLNSAACKTAGDSHSKSLEGGDIRSEKQKSSDQSVESPKTKDVADSELSPVLNSKSEEEADLRVKVPPVPSKLVNAQSARENELSPKETNATGTEEIKGGSRDIVNAGLKDPSFIARAFEESNVRKAAEPLQKLAAQVLPQRAEAAVEAIKNDTHSVPIVDSETQESRSGRTARRSESGTNHAISSTESKTVTITESGSITPSSIETRIVGFNKKSGAPILKGPDGITLPSFRPFENPANSAKFIQADNSAATNTVAGTISPNVVSQTNLRRPSAERSGTSRLTSGYPEDSFLGDSENDFSAGSSQASGTYQRKSPTISASNEAPIALGSNFATQSYAVDSLQNVPVQSSSDVMRVIKAADRPRELLKQQWFVDHLKSPRIQMQIYDDGIQPVGAEKPRTRVYLKTLLKKLKKDSSP